MNVLGKNRVGRAASMTETIKEKFSNSHSITIKTYLWQKVH